MPILGTLPRMSQPSTSISGTTTINWLAGPIFIDNALPTSTSYSFTNEQIGQEITVVIGGGSGNTIEIDFTPSSGNLQWENGERVDQVGPSTWTVLKFVKVTSSVIVGSIISEKVKADIGYRTVRDFYMTDPANVGFELTRWERISGTGTMSYENSSDNGMGYGRYAFDGDCVYMLKDFIPVMPYTGAGGYGRYKKAVGTSNIYLGAKCFDGNKNDLATFKAFVANNASVSTSWALAQGRAKMEGGDNENFATGTRFIKPYISITNYTGTVSDKVYVSGFNIYTSNFSTVADYA